MAISASGNSFLSQLDEVTSKAHFYVFKLICVVLSVS